MFGGGLYIGCLVVASIFDFILLWPLYWMWGIGLYLGWLVMISDNDVWSTSPFLRVH